MVNMILVEQAVNILIFANISMTEWGKLRASVSSMDTHMNHPLVYIHVYLYYLSYLHLEKLSL